MRYFLPAFDRAGGSEDLRRHLPLLDQLAAFAHTPQALKNSQQNMRRFNRREPEKYVEAVKRTAGSYRVQVMQRLQAIKGFLALSQAERLPMYTWLNSLHKPEVVFNQIMDDSDRQQAFALLKRSEKPGGPRSAVWLNPVSRVKFTLTLNTRTGGKGGSGYRTRLVTDLNPRLGLERDRAYSKRCSPNFSNDPQSGWRLQVK